MGRSKIREHIFKLLFMSQFNTEEEMPQQLTIYFNELEELDESDRAYMQEKYEQVISHLKEIDELLNQLSKGWKTSRMARVDLTALRLSVYELKYEEEIPTRYPSMKLWSLQRDSVVRIPLRLSTEFLVEWRKN